MTDNNQKFAELFIHSLLQREVKVEILSNLEKSVYTKDEMDHLFEFLTLEKQLREESEKEIQDSIRERLEKYFTDHIQNLIKQYCHDRRI